MSCLSLTKSSTAGKIGGMLFSLVLYTPSERKYKLFRITQLFHSFPQPQYGELDKKMKMSQISLLDIGSSRLYKRNLLDKRKHRHVMLNVVGSTC